MILSRATRAPPLSPLQMSPVRELAHRFTGNILGAGHPGRNRSSNMSWQSWKGTNLTNIYKSTELLKYFLLEFNFLQFGLKTAGVGFSSDVVTGGVLIENRVDSPAQGCARPLCWQVQGEVIIVRETQRSEHNNSHHSLRSD